MDKNNAGFSTLKGFAYVFLEEVSAVGSLGTGKAEVILQPGSGWKEVYFTPGTGKWSEKSQPSGAGTVWAQECKIVSVKEVKADWLQLNDMATREVLVRLQFDEGYRLVGDQEYGVTLNVENDDNSGEQVGFSFMRTVSDKSRWLV